MHAKTSNPSPSFISNSSYPNSIIDIERCSSNVCLWTATLLVHPAMSLCLSRSRSVSLDPWLADIPSGRE